MEEARRKQGGSKEEAKRKQAGNTQEANRRKSERRRPPEMHFAAEIGEGSWHPLGPQHPQLPVEEGVEDWEDTEKAQS